MCDGQTGTGTSFSQLVFDLLREGHFYINAGRNKLKEYPSMKKSFIKN
jgi:hypothetical protein